MALFHLSSASSGASASRVEDVEDRSLEELEGVSTYDVHDFISQLEEMFSRQRLGEEVRDVVSCGYEWNANLAVLNALSEEEMTPFDVFHPGIVFRVLR